MPVTAQTLVLAGQGIVKLVVRHAREETRLQGHLRLATMASCVRDGKLEREQMPGGLLFLLSEVGHRVLSCGRLLAHCCGGAFSSSGPSGMLRACRSETRSGLKYEATSCTMGILPTRHVCFLLLAWTTCLESCRSLTSEKTPPHLPTYPPMNISFSSQIALLNS